MGKSHGAEGRSARCIALLGPYLSGKTTLLEAILARTGAIPKQGSVTEGTSVGDASAEARSHGMSIGLNVAEVDFLGETFTFIDCPGSIEFQTESAAALSICDAAIVVTEPDSKRVPALQVILKSLEDRKIPHFLFLNKIDASSTAVRDVLPLLQPASAMPLVLRQIPIWKDGIAVGFVDLASERAYVYREHAPSEIVELPASMGEREQEARFSMLEQLADYDDDLMEQLLSDMEPPNDRVFDDLGKELRDGLICPVLIGSALNGNGILRMMKALRHEVPFVDSVARRLKLENTGSSALVFKTMHTGHGGKLSLARVLTGDVADGATLTSASGAEQRVAGVFSMRGEEAVKRGTAKAGDTVAFGRLDGIGTGDTLTAGSGGIVQAEMPKPSEPVFVVGVGLKDRKDEVKLSAALTKLLEEDPSLEVEHNKDTNQILLKGQGDMHLRVAFERLARKFGIDVERHRERVPYKETIRKGIEVRGRHKKQSGGHGQFGDVVIDIQPRGRGEGFHFAEKVTGGAVPKQFFPSVEIGAKDYLQHGPLGFPVVDVSVTLLDGSYHSVDSSDMAFRQAARIAMADGMSQCSPVLLEPIMAVEIATPSEATSRVNAIISQRRGHILGFDSREGWPGWDVIQASMPASEMADLIIELRSVTSGVGTYHAHFDHLAELTGRLADQVVTSHAQAAE